MNAATKVAAHTPGPWKVRVNSGRYGPTGSMGQIHNGDASKPIGNVVLADAEFIVRACNAHDDLLAALRDTLTICLERGHKLGLDDGGPVMDKARAAIAKAQL